MRNYFFITLTYLVLGSSVKAQLGPQDPLFLELKQQDSLFFELGFNQCNLSYLESHVSDDLRFFHDQVGVQDKASFLESMQANICGNPSVKPIRKLESSSLRVFPLYNNGNTRSSIQRAELNEQSAQLNYDQTVENLKIAVQQALADAQALKKRFEASNKAVDAQQLAFDNATKRLEIGATNTFEWEAQRTNLESAQITNLIDKYNYLFNIKILEFYLGKPLKL